MNHERGQQPQHLGDGVYASHDGYQVWLTTGHHLNNPLVALEAEVIMNLVLYAKRIGMQIE